MKQLFTIYFITLSFFGAKSQIFHKKYNYTSEIMYNMSSVVNNNRIYNASSGINLPGMVNIQKTDLAGNWIATQRLMFGTTTPAVVVRKMITSGTKLYIVGNTYNSPGGQTDAFLVVLDTALTSITYARSFGTPSNYEDFYDVLLASNNDLVMVGNSSAPTATVGVYKYLPYVVRIASGTGTVVYQKTFEDNISKYCYSVVEDAANNSLFISGGSQTTNATHILKITDDNLGTVLSAKNMYFSSTGMNVKKLQVYGSKLFLIGGDPSNNLMTVETDLALSLIVMPKYYTNFRYFDHVKVGNTNYIAGLTVPTGTYSYLSSLKMDSLFNYQAGMTYSLVPVPVFVNWFDVNVVNKSNTMYWMAQEGWTAPNMYTNRYHVASDMNLNATCNTPLTLITGTNVNTMGITTYSNPVTTFTVANMFASPLTLTPTVTTLCSATGIENVNEQFGYFVIRTSGDKVMIASPYSEYVISLFDISGKMLLSKQADSNEELNISDLSSGIYILKLSANGFEQRQKIIKQ
jgi:hypothetical protein